MKARRRRQHLRRANPVATACCRGPRAPSTCRGSSTCGSRDRSRRRISSVASPPAPAPTIVVDDRAVGRVLRRTARRAGSACRCTCSSGSGYAAAGLKSVSAARRRVAAAICRSGSMSSRIQNDRPCVPTAMSSSLSTRSRIDVAGMLRRSDDQWSPSSNETQTCVSDPGEEQPAALRIFAHDVDRRAVGNAVRDLRPRLAAVVRAVDVRPEVVEPNRVDRGVRGLRVEAPGVDDRDLAPRSDRAARAA